MLVYQRICHVMAPKSKVCQRREYSMLNKHTWTRIRTIEPSSKRRRKEIERGRFGSSFWRLTSNSPSVLFYCYPSKILVIFHVVNPIKNHPQVRSRHNALFLTFGTSASSLAALPGETERSAKGKKDLWWRNLRTCICVHIIYIYTLLIYCISQLVELSS